ncbi:MAG: F0F1 ATP synthase subunit gamma, partial [Pseudomonadales bacterium]|nr:F0F1 ATP synthase subunit gamma [Pseudomonadales bacterium]
MAGAKEIRTKIRSVQSTQKITKAMEMVAASKMRKALERMQAARPYASRIRNVISHLAHAHTEYRSPGLVEREIKRVGLIVISTDRGLCGGLNTNLFKAAITSMQDWRQRGVEIDLCTIGTKAFQFFRRLRGN